MGELVVFPAGPIHSGIAAATAKIEIAKEIFCSTTNELEMAVELLDRMAAKLELMRGLLPGSLKSGFGKRQLDIRDQIDLVRSKAASLADHSQKLLNDKMADS